LVSPQKKKTKKKKRRRRRRKSDKCKREKRERERREGSKIGETCLGGIDSPRRSRTKSRQPGFCTISVITLTFMRQRAEVSMLMTLLLVPVRHWTRNPLAVSKGKHEVVHRGP